jgi:hypothetical protein
VSRVVSRFRNDGRGQVGNLAAVWQAIFTDPEAATSSETSEFAGRILDPFELAARFLRPLDGTQVNTFSDTGSSVNDMFLGGVRLNGRTTGYLGTPTMRADFSVFPLFIGSIFGPYPPEFTVDPAQGWGQLIPEMGSWPSNLITQVYNRIIDISTRGPAGFRDLSNPGSRFNYYTYPPYDATIGDLATITPTQIVERLNLLLCSGKLDRAKRKIMIDAITPLPATDDATREDRVRVLIQALAATREALIQ